MCKLDLELEYDLILVQQVSQILITFRQFISQNFLAKYFAQCSVYLLYLCTFHWMEKKTWQMFRNIKNWKRNYECCFPSTHKKTFRFFIYFFAYTFRTKIIYLFIFIFIFIFWLFFRFLGSSEEEGGVFDDNKRLNGPTRRMTMRGKTEIDDH